MSAADNTTPAWEFTGLGGLTRFITQHQYAAQPLNVQKWYRPICPTCGPAAGGTGFAAMRQALLAAREHINEGREALIAAHKHPVTGQLDADGAIAAAEDGALVVRIDSVLAMLPAPCGAEKTQRDAESARGALDAPGCERLRDFYAVGPVQRAAVESFADALLKEPS